MTNYTVAIGESRIAVDWSRMPEAARERIIAYGVQRIFNDKVGSKEKFPTEREKVEYATAQVERFYAGDIGRQRAESESDEVVIGRMLCRRAMKAALSSEQWKKFTALTDDEQNAKLDANVEKNAEAFATAIADELARRKAEAEKRAKLANKLALDF